MKEEDLRKKLLLYIKKKEQESEVSEEFIKMRKLIMEFLEKFIDSIDEEHGKEK